MERRWGVLAVFFILASVYLVGSVTRTISDTQDNKDTLIRNSEGHYWEVNETNLQAAIDDLDDEPGGTVWVGGNLTLSSPLEPKSYIMLDFQNNVVTMENDVPFINVTACRFGAVKNVKVIVTEGHTSSVILLYNPPGATWPDRVRYMTFENIHITNPGIAHDYTGIKVDIRTSNMAINTFRNIQMENCENGLHLKSPGPTGWGNGFYFENIWVDGFETLVWFDGCGIANKDFNHNVFQSVKGKASAWTKDGFKDINGQSNHFDQCGVSNWEAASSPNHDWSIASSAGTAYICPTYMHSVLDNGGGTRFC